MRKARVQFKEELAVVTEFNQMRLDLLENESECASPAAVMGSIMKENLWSFERNPCDIASPSTAEMRSLLSVSGSWDSETSGSIPSFGSGSKRHRTVLGVIGRGLDPPAIRR